LKKKKKKKKKKKRCPEYESSSLTHDLDLI